jgi:hypothetical protein
MLIAEQFKVQCSYVDRGCKETVVFKVTIIFRGGGNKLVRFQ